MKEKIRVQLKKVVPMSNQGFSHWNRHLIKRIYPYVFKSMKPELVSIEDLKTKEKIADYTWYLAGEGKYHISFCCHSKNKFKVSYKTACIIELASNDSNGYEIKDFRIKNLEKDYKIIMFKNKRLKRYWFWKLEEKYGKN